MVHVSCNTFNCNTCNCKNWCKYPLLTTVNLSVSLLCHPRCLVHRLIHPHLKIIRKNYKLLPHVLKIMGDCICLYQLWTKICINNSIKCKNTIKQACKIFKKELFHFVNIEFLQILRRYGTSLSHSIGELRCKICSFLQRSLPDTIMVKIDSMFDLGEDSQSAVSVEQASCVPLSADDITNGSRLVVAKKQDSSGNDELTISRRWTDAKAKFLKVSSDGPRMHQRIVGGGNDSFAVQLNIATDPIRRTELWEDPAFRRAAEMIPRLSLFISSLWTDVAVIGNTPEGFPASITNMYSTK